MKNVIVALMDLGLEADEMLERGFSEDYVAGLKRGYRTAINIIDPTWGGIFNNPDGLGAMPEKG